MATNKDTLDLILKNTQDLAKSQLDFAAKVSIEFNKQDSINKKVLGYLENNENTNQKGAIQRLDDIDNRVHTLEDDTKITKGKVGAVVSFSIVIVGAFWSVFVYLTK